MGSGRVDGALVFGYLDRDPANAFALSFGLLPDPGLDLGGLFQSGTEYRGVLLFDPLVANAAAQITGMNEYGSPDGAVISTTYLSAPSVVTPAARAPTTLAPGAMATGSFAKDYDTDFYHLTTDGTAQIIAFTVAASAGAMLLPRVELYAGGGLGADRIADVLSFGNVAVGYPIPFSNVASDLYAVVMDESFRGGTAFGYALKTTKFTATPLTEQSSAHGTQGSAQSLGTPTGPIVLTGSLSAGLEQDWYQVAVTAFSNCPAFTIISKAVPVTVQYVDSNGSVGTEGGLGSDPKRPQSGFNSNNCGTLAATPWYFVVLSDSASSMGAYTIGLQ